jgi:hypothetical protein
MQLQFDRAVHAALAADLQNATVKPLPRELRLTHRQVQFRSQSPDAFFLDLGQFHNATVSA